jgi:hypothetical protein
MRDRSRSAIGGIACVAMLLAGCQATGSPLDEPAPSSGVATSGAGGSTDGASAGGSTDGTSAGGSTDGAATPTDTPAPPAGPPGPDANAVGDLAVMNQRPHCDFLPNGGINGGDVVSVSVHVSWDSITLPSRTVPIRATTSSGDSGQEDTTVDRTPDTLTAIQFTPNPGDFGTTLRITLTVDPDNVIPETNPNNNVSTVSFPLPGPRPVVAMADLPCSMP